MKNLSLGYKFSSPFSWKEREAGIQKSTTEVYDYCVVGGGITGAAIARDAALRGLKVLLVEKDDFAQGTSSRSSKLVHGGVRYLEQYEFKLVMESTRERARLWKLAPHLVTPLKFLFPAFKGARVPLWQLSAGLWLYDILAKFRLPGLHRLYFKKRTLQEEPKLKSDGLKGAIFYWDGATDDAKLTLSNLIDAFMCGGNILSKVRVTGVKWNAQVENGEAHEISLRDQLTGKSLTAKARIVVCATGPWTDEFMRETQNSKRKFLAPTRGSHIVISSKRLPTTHAITIFHPTDGRVLFSIPWSEATVVGTTDLFDKDSPDQTKVTSDEVNYLLEAANSYFPTCKLVRDDVLSTWTGLRPLLAPPENASASQISREHLIEFHKPGLLIIAGGKLTTHREMAEQAVDAIFKGTKEWQAQLGKGNVPTETRDRPLPDFEFPRRKGPALGQSEAGNLDLEDIKGICSTQMVLSLEDLLVRRSSIYYKEPHNGWLLIPKLKATLCSELNWSEEKWQQEVANYKQYLDHTILGPLGRLLPAN